MSTTRSPLSSWICGSLPGQPGESPEPEAPASTPVSTAPVSTVVAKPRGTLEALSRREPIEPPPPSQLPLGYRRSRSSGARVMLGIAENPWKKRG